MKFLNPFEKKEQPQEPQKADQLPETEREHLQLFPYWDSVEDMGNEEKATGYRCGICGASFSRKAADILDRRTKAIKL